MLFKILFLPLLQVFAIFSLLNRQAEPSSLLGVTGNNDTSNSDPSAALSPSSIIGDGSSLPETSQALTPSGTGDEPSDINPSQGAGGGMGNDTTTEPTASHAFGPPGKESHPSLLPPNHHHMFRRTEPSGCKCMVSVNATTCPPGPSSTCKDGGLTSVVSSTSKPSSTSIIRVVIL
ncbi:hypothetical protein TREMEDRAFT_63476 [Tremella mesenterica DSM 1558]|uniref:uncharacterized protein n=1 Tax=Tremella mesenterica (strain ATCC 24925 / CBS 8224 / DSM 1558 / NBRC 9311 / NRRL Y-6157 / RJB 2259-6 / UBC 559-6) TaxID=578456 RepID=UPI0003F4A396|nr:uncharacterized protein TREMEDRAFT_63476 [Tremella mesenterica DSM 1558]EIW68304.1 hypothetical protein TREMEDRAFT_63476 [Tremella mesenterica DSM 1558]